MIRITDQTRRVMTTESDSSPGNYKGTLYDYKTSYVARKIEEDELYVNPMKTSNFLAKINEETYNDIDEPGMVQTLDSVDLKQEGVYNIFQSELLNHQKYKEHNRGPVYGKDGHIVKHSVVGPAEMFEKLNKPKRQNMMKDSNISIEKESGSEFTPTYAMKNRPQSHKSQDQISSSFADSKFTGFGITGMHNKKKESKHNDVVMKKDDLLDHIDKLREAQDQFYREEQNKYSKLPIADRLYLTKETRIIENYEKKLNDWDNLNEKVNKKVGRKPDFSITTKGEAFRRKKEQATILDAVLPDHERYGKMYWHMTLRKPVPKLKTTKDGVEIPEDFETTLFKDKKEKLEILAKPRPYTRDSGRTYTGKTERDYLSSRLSQREKIIDKINPPKSDQLKEFVIEGSNKLNTEVDAFFKLSGRKDVFSVPKNFFEKKNQNIDLMIEQNYERQEIMKNGLATVIKMN